jgi:hypothetical protein
MTTIIRDVGFQLWRQLSQVLGEKVTKSNFQVVLRRYQQTQTQLKNPPANIISTASYAQLIGLLMLMIKLDP